MIKTAGLLTLLVGVDGFAYAPNFITKIIEQQTGVEPVGLMEVDEGDNNNKQDDPNTLDPTVTNKVTTRFPPEPNGYLHLGHAKAVSFNFQVARMFDGECHMRLDDTNPTKEDKEYVESILEDVRWIQSGIDDENTETTPWVGPVRKTSDYFDLIYDCAEALIKTGDAYVDSLSAEEMKEYRGTLTEPGKDSPDRTRSIEESLEIFQGMRDGKFKEGEYIVRAKIDMSSPNLNLRDPALYRIKHESHQETGDKWCIYPMYDFSHPISDAVEGITHSLCTLEFEDHRPFYDWVVDKLLDASMLKAKPQQIEFSRLNIKNTVLSKRKLIQLVDGNHVNGWDDPRMPTLSGIRRRGVPPSALRLFCERVGISKSDSNIDYVVLEDCVREDMDKVAPRAFCILNPLKVTLTNWPGSDEIEEFEIPRHPKREELGNRIIPFGKNLYIERDDFFDLEGPEGAKNGGNAPRGWKRLLPNENVRLKFAYAIKCDEVVRDPETQEPIELKCTYLPETRAGVTPEGMKRVKGIVHWVEADAGIKCQVNQYDRLFKTEEPGKESGDYLQDLNPKSLEVVKNVVVEPSVAVDALATLAKVSESDGKESASSLSYQFERNGYFALDAASKDDDLVFNRVVTLRDTWGAAGQPKKKKQQQQQRNRGGNRQPKQPQGGAGNVEDLRRVALRAATIVSAEQHPDADSLLLLSVDCGDVGEDGEPSEPRTVVAGLAGKIPIEELVGKKIVAVTNLKPAKMRGILSHAMLLAAASEDDEIVELLSVPDSVPNGELVSFEGKDPSEPDPMMKSKGALKVWDRVKSGLTANGDGEATYSLEEATHRMMTSGGPVKTTSLQNAKIS